MKRILIRLKWSVLPLALVVMAASSCKKDFLDRRPLGRYTDEDIPAGSFDIQVFAAYALLRANGLNHHLYLGIHSYRSDEAMKGSSTSDGSDQEAMYDNFQYVATNGGIQEYWTANYAVIIAANAIIADIDSIGTPEPQAVLNRAEAKFLRAHTYFNLVKNFGRVPVVDFEITEASQINIPKAETVEEVYALIDADLNEAEAALPLSWAGYPGRASKGAAMSLHARSYMFRKNYVAALGKCREVIGLNQYALTTNYSNIFRKEGENNSESIFEVQAAYTPTNDNGIIYTNVQGVRGAGDWDLGWGWNVPTQQLVDEFEAGDPRRIETILYSGQVDPLYNEAVPPSPSVVPQPYWNKKVYTNPTDRRNLNNRFGPWMNHRIIRYADVLLMAAEAANEVGGAANTTDALMWLEMVRARARGGNAALLLPVTTTVQADLREAIRHERFVELGMEESRFYDIVRWEIDVEVLHAAGKTDYEVKHRLLPLPQAEIDKSGGVLIQNPDYQ